MTTNESITSIKTRNFQSIGFIGLIKLSVLSMIAGILLGELSFWMLIDFSIFILRSFNSDFSDFGAMTVGIFMGFYLKPVVSGISTFVGFSVLLRKSKTVTYKNPSATIFGISLIYAASTIVAMGISVIVSAIEAKIPLANLSGIYLLFIR